MRSTKARGSVIESGGSQGSYTKKSPVKRGDRSWKSGGSQGGSFSHSKREEKKFASSKFKKGDASARAWAREGAGWKEEMAGKLEEIGIDSETRTYQTHGAAKKGRKKATTTGKRYDIVDKRGGKTISKKYETQG